jgi:hypothetical protein
MVYGPEPAQRQRNQRLTVRTRDQSADKREFIGRRLAQVTEECQHLAEPPRRKQCHAAVDDRTYGVKVELEGSRNAEVRARATHRPEQVGVLVRARRQVVTVGSDDIDGAEVVAGQAVHSHQVPDSTTKRQARHTGP